MSKETIGILEQLLEKNDKVLVICNTKRISEMLPQIPDMLRNMAQEHKVLLLADMRNMEGISDRFCIISTEEMEHIRKLYGLYEFSDKFVIFPQPGAYCGNIMNYAKSGLMTEKECLQAMLEK